MFKSNITSTDYSRFKPSNWDYTKLIHPFRALLHPAATFEAVKYEKVGSMALANLIFLGLILSGILQFTATGFIFNMNRTEDFNLIKEILKAALLPVLWCVASFSMTTLFDGEGTFEEIWIVTFYAFLPRLLTSIPLSILSNFISIEENVFISMTSTIALVFSICLLIVGMMKIHQFSLVRTLLMAAVSVGVIACILFIAMLLFSMFGQMISFFESIYEELYARV